MSANFQINLHVGTAGRNVHTFGRKLRVSIDDGGDQVVAVHYQSQLFVTAGQLGIALRRATAGSRVMRSFK